MGVLLVGSFERVTGVTHADAEELPDYPEPVTTAADPTRTA
jgi:hypothetical protein